MKKIKLFTGIIFLISIGFFTSCNFGTLSEAPKITIDPLFDTVPVGQKTYVTFNVTIEPDIINNASITELYIDLWDIALDSVTFTDVAKTVYYEYIFEVSDTVEEGDYFDITFYAIDDKNKSQVETATITVGTGGNTNVTVLSFNGKTFTADANSLSKNNFLDAQTGILYPANHSDVAILDLTYMYHGAWNYFIASPDAAGLVTVYDLAGVTYSTTGKNTTHIQKITSVTSLDQVTVVFLENLTISDDYVANSSSNGIGTELIEGDFIAFQTEDGFKGVFEVTDLTYISSKAAETSMTCDIRVLSESISGK